MSPPGKEIPRSSFTLTTSMSLVSLVPVPSRTNLKRRGPSWAWVGPVQGGRKPKRHMGSGSLSGCLTGITSKSLPPAWVSDPHFVLGAIIPARIGNTADISGTLVSLTSSNLLSRSQLPGRTEESTAASQVESATGSQGRARKTERAE